MSDLIKKMRHRRYQIKANAEIKFLVETSTGTRLNLHLDNVSISGLAGWTEQPLPNLTDDGLDVGGMLPASKISFEGHEYTLGRLVLRTIKQDGGKTFLGFSTVDGKVPVDSALSFYVDSSLDELQSAYEFELSPDKFSMASFAEPTSKNVDLFAKVKQFSVFVKDWEKSPKFSYKNVRLASMGQRIRLSKKRKNGREDYLIMGSNDYLGLAAHPEVREAAKAAIDKYGFGSTGSPVSTGNSDLHVELVDKLSKMLKKEKVLLFNSGYTANVGIISGLLHAQDLVVADVLSHASIQDGMQMCKGTSRFFKHNNVNHLEQLLSENREEYAGCLVITEGVFSMDGDVPPLDKIAAVAKKHKARLMVDEAHSFGVIGNHGLGTCEKFELLKQTDLIMGTFSKIGGGIGGFVAANEDVVDWLHFWARSHLFTVALPPSTAAAALKALELFESDKSLISNLRSNIQHFKRGLTSLGYHLSPEHESAVIPVVVGDEKKLEIMNQTFMDAGVFVVPVVYPVVSRTNARFRFTIMANHTISDLDYVLNTLEIAMERADMKFAPRLANEKAS